MSSSTLSERPVKLLGDQLPRLSWRPSYVKSLGQDAADLAAVAGLYLDPWQQYVLDVSLSQDDYGKWSAMEIALIVARQNGKGSILEARELAGLFLLNERVIIHTAHEFKTAKAAFARIQSLIMGCDALKEHVDKWSASNGVFGVKLKTGQELVFQTRTKGAGRGLTGDCVILDEAMYLDDDVVGALMPVAGTRPNPQIWYTGSAVNQEIHPELTFTRVRNRGLRGGDDGLAFMEWSAPGTIDEHDPTDRELWAMANPGLGYRQSEKFIALEQRSMGRRQFAVEILGIGDWPSEDKGAKAIEPAAWRKQAADMDADEAQPAGQVAFAVEVNTVRGWSSISSAWRRQDGRRQVAVIDNQQGTEWVPGRLSELVAEFHPCAVVLDPGSATNALSVAIENVGVELTKTTTREFIQACGAFHAGITEGTVCQPDDQVLNDAADEAKWRMIGDSRAFERRNPAADMAPFMACVLALFGVDKHGRDGQPFNIW